jgi:predicted ATPase
LPETRATYEAARSSKRITPKEAAPTPKWATLPGSDLPLVGREGALATLAEAHTQFHSGGVIFITGEAGAGKSRLMQTFANAHNALVLAGNSHAEGNSIPYQPLVQALRQALPLRSRWQQTSPIWLAELSRLLPELRAHFPNLPAPIGVAPQQAQARLFEALRQVFSSLAVESPLLLCLDDVHWADESTKGWLLYFTRQLRGSGICILATYRMHEQQAVASWQWALRRTGLMTVLTLDGLSVTAVSNLLRQLYTNLPNLKRLAHRIHTATGGNPFFVLETIRELIAREQFDENPANLPLSPTVREAVLHRVGDLTPLARQILEVTAILSTIATLDLIAETAGRDGLETATALN